MSMSNEIFRSSTAVVTVEQTGSEAIVTRLGHGFDFHVQVPPGDIVVKFTSIAEQPSMLHLVTSPQTDAQIIGDSFTLHKGESHTFPLTVSEDTMLVTRLGWRVGTDSMRGASVTYSTKTAGED